MRYSKGSVIFAYIVMILGGVIMLYPFLFQMFGALITANEYENLVFLPLPQDLGAWRFKSMLYIFSRSNVWYSIGLTIAKVVWYVVITTFTNVVGGYIFQKTQFWGKTFIFYFFMASMMIPGIATVVPGFVWNVRFPLVGGNNIFGQGGTGFYQNIAMHFVQGLVGIGGIFLYMQGLKGLGNEYKEAAEIDGAGFFGTVFKVYFPMLLPLIGMNIINTFIGQWNDYSTCLFYLDQNEKAWTIGYTITQELNALGLQRKDGTPPEYPKIFGLSFMFLLPPIIIYIAFQDMFISGLTMGTIKS